jgi:hypothetical protein
MSVGTAHAWGNREPGSVLQLMLASGAANPLIIIDEVEKAGGSDWNGDPRSAVRTSSPEHGEMDCGRGDFSIWPWLKL